MASPAYTDAIMLFGDSLTQAWSDGSLSQRMAEYYLRRCDIVSRGFGGYNSDWAIPVFEQVFATKEAREKGYAQNVKLITIWLGANDATLPGEPQCVPLDRYKSNLVKLVQLIRDPSSAYHSPDTKIVLINAPPIIEDAWVEARIEKWKSFGSTGPKPEQNRDKAVTKAYAEAAIEVAKEQKVEIVDVWTAIVETAGGEGAEQLAPYFYDGLHLTSEGYAVLFKALSSLIITKYPKLNPETMPMRMPQ
uniref:GDSL Lipase/Acylhydrolase n=1 Tax=Kwoniella dejecticola CBS 10117 TaxID=1296121 RepID=A0A1A6A8V7_9TREE|nr:GDSL Lipase/Acylhydrolase [Kwoniella dejecticola CBS 10117]OBR86493.1 GDSL Lipase/Acylhydrolase [Kwoniella dejecticola CBS 10117]